LIGVVQTGGCISACWTGAARAWHKRVAVPWCLRDGRGAGKRERMWACEAGCVCGCTGVRKTREAPWRAVA